MGQAGRRLAALALGSAIAAVAGELLLRLLAPQPTGRVQYAFDPELGAIPVPLQRAPRTLPGVYTYTYTNDGDGLRLVPPLGIAPSRTILVLGDSFAYGIGVNDDQTFCAVLQQALGRTERPARVLDGGVGGKGTDFALKLFLTRSTRFRAQVVVLAFLGNDFCDNAREEYFASDAEGALQPKDLRDTPASRKSFLARIPGYDWLILRSHLANLVKLAAVRWIYAGAPSRPLQGCAQPAPVALTARYLHALAEAVRASGAELDFFYIPTGLEVAAARQGHAPSGEEQAGLRLAREEGVPAFSFTPVLAASPHSLGDLYLAEGHWTAAAHALAGAFLAERLRAAGGP